MSEAIGFLLTTGQIALIDPEDAWLLRIRWKLTVRPEGVGYVRRDDNRRIPQFAHLDAHLHRIILTPPPGMVIDHINGDTLDNRRCNLRAVQQTDNARNLGTGRKNASSPYLGVAWHSRDQVWYATIRVDGRLHHLGNFTDAEKARQARAKAEIEMWGVQPRRATELNRWGT